MRKDEPRYVNAGEEFDEEDYAWRYIDDFVHQEMIKEVFSVCGNRKYFKSPKESKKWNRIDERLSKGLMRMEWVQNCIAWAREKNKTRIAIKVDILGRLVLNRARMQDWLEDNKEDLIRPEDYF